MRDSSKTSPRGILKNRRAMEENLEDQKLAEEKELDRQTVIKNTYLNAQSVGEGSEGDRIRNKIAKDKKGQDDGKETKDEGGSPHEHLHWDEMNLYKTEQEKTSTMKIDEPKTPYEGGFNPEGEYYRSDDEEENIPEFELGKGEVDSANNEGANVSLKGSSIEKAPEEESSEEKSSEEERTPTAEERHKLFEEKRKAHYHMKGEALKHRVDPSDEEE